VAAALAVSGLSADAFSFAGFLPARREARQRRLRSLLARAETVVFFEAPHRVRDTLELLVREAPDRPLAAARELTKAFEEVLRGSPPEVLAQLTPERERGEWTVVIGPPRAGDRRRAASLPESMAGGGRGSRGTRRAPAAEARRAFERDLMGQGIDEVEARRRAEFVFGGAPRPRAGAGRRERK
jgi:16S rRNA (cytidine1402-2'-O)-methyltransferase